MSENQEHAHEYVSFPKQLACRGSGGPDKGPVYIFGFRGAPAHPKNIEKHMCFGTCLSKTQKTRGFCHNLQHKVPFGIPRTGFCMCLSARIFCFVMPRGRFLSPGLDFGIQVQHFGLVSFLGSTMGPDKSEFATESFCGGLAGDFPRPK